ncbi:MAG: hypothetical protein NTZ48_04100, partial [Candidatus Omnitrophica bacterium]|nr:hypothetical protein [Candidatus Omnitrophota bacterium]
RWIANGCTGTAPPPVKRMVLSFYLQRFGLNQFIETGTHFGDMLAYIARDKTMKCTSIELADHYYQSAMQRFASYTNVTLLHGDSGAVLPECVSNLQAPALFWLDGHYSGGTTVRGEVDTPVSAELKAILDSSIKTHVILIDDARCFNGTNTYPQLDEILRSVRREGFHDIEVSADIIRITPQKHKYE